jgi:hypothetical protein
MVLHTVRQDGEVVPPFEDTDEAALGAFLGKLQDHFPHFPVRAPGEGLMGHGVILVSIKARRNEDELRGKLPEAGEALLLQVLKIGVITAPGDQGDIQGETLAFALALLFEVAGAGKAGERVFVEREKKHPGVCFEEVLRAVSVMYVPVNNGHPLQAVIFQEILSA